MKNKFFILNTIISSCLLTIACNQSTANELHPRMPNGQQPCYPGSKCTGDPNLIGGPRGNNMPANNGACSSRYNNPDQQNYNQPNSYGYGNNSQQNTGNNNYNQPYYQNHNESRRDSLYGAQTPSNYSDSQSTNMPKMLQTESTEKFKGSVKAVNKVNLPNQTQMQMTLSTDQGDMLVILGPVTYLEQQKIRLNPGDKVVVTGYRIKGNGKEMIIAAQVDKNGTSLKLLDENRRPVWGNDANMGNQGLNSYDSSQSYGNTGYQTYTRGY